MGALGIQPTNTWFAESSVMTVVAPVSAASVLALIGVGGANGTESMFKPLVSVTL